MRGPVAELRRRTWAKRGVLAGALIGCTLGGLVPGSAYHLVLPMIAIVVYWVAAIVGGRWGGGWHVVTGGGS